MQIIEIDLDAPFDVSDAADLIDGVGADGALSVLQQAHMLTHGVTVQKLGDAKWRPWRRRRILRDQREVCAEIQRRMLLVRDVANASESE